MAPLTHGHVRPTYFPVAAHKERVGFPAATLPQALPSYKLLTGGQQRGEGMALEVQRPASTLPELSDQRQASPVRFSIPFSAPHYFCAGRTKMLTSNSYSFIHSLSIYCMLGPLLRTWGYAQEQTHRALLSDSLPSIFKGNKAASGPSPPQSMLCKYLWTLHN